MKRVLSFLLIMCLVIVMIPNRNNEVQAASYGDFEYEVLDDGTVEITGYVGNQMEVTIPTTISGRKVSAINTFYLDLFPEVIKLNVEEDNQIFSSQDGVLFNKEKTKLILYPRGRKQTTYQIPEGTQKIEEYAFAGNSSLEKVSFTDSVTVIESFAFLQCENLKTVDLSRNLKEINFCSFMECKKLEKIDIPNNVTEIHQGAFEFCESLAEVNISDSVELIGDEVFQGCINLKKIDVDSKNTTYSSSDGVLFNKSKTSLIRYPVGKADEIYTVPNGVKNICVWAFTDGKNLKQVILSQQLEKIELEAFLNCEKLSNIEIPKSVKEIGNGVFWNCIALSRVVLVEGIQKIGEDAFDNCSSLESIIIPKSVVQIESFAFADCKKLKEIKILNSKCHIYDEEYTIESPAVIYGYDKSTAFDYAKKYNRKFLSLGNDAVIGCVHNYQNRITKATLNKNGSIIRKCNKCGNIITSTIIYRPKTINLSKASYTYNKKSRKPSISMWDCNGKVINTSNYSTVYVGGRKNVGQYQVKITFKGNYSGTITKTFKVVPKGTSISKLRGKSKGFTVKWRRQKTQTTGYQIQYSTTKKFRKGIKTITIGKNAVASKKISKLRKKKRYYVRIRTYKNIKINGQFIKIYSGWSKSKTILTRM